MKNTKIYSCFPGTGKTHFFNSNTELSILDSDSSLFDKTKFPDNYIKHIKSNIGKVDIILVSSHESVRRSMTKERIIYNLVYPNKRLISEYKKRYKKRGSSAFFIRLIVANWADWIRSCSDDRGATKHYILRQGQYLSDIIKN